MKKDFKLDNSNAIEGSAGYFDLHNDFYLKAIHLSLGVESALEMILHKRSGSWVAASTPAQIRIVFEKLLFLELSPSIVSDFSSTIEEIGYKDANDQDYDWLLGEENSTLDSHLFFMLENYEYIRVYCEKINLLISQ
jgi:hypothetical protein